MISRNRLEALKSFWDKESATLGGVNALIPEYVREEVDGPMRRAGTLLQAAAAEGSEDTVKWLLEEKDADPTVPVSLLSTHEDAKDSVEDAKSEEGEEEQLPLNPGAKRVAYDLARTKTVRDIFRRCAATYPDKWDWLGAARVPSGLSKEMEEEREEKKKVRRKGLKEKVKEREREMAAKKVEEPEPEPVLRPKQENLTGPRKLGGTAGAVEAIAGLTPEMRARVERERRARAAEARFRVPGKSP